MAESLTLPAVTAALVAAGVQTVVSWPEQATMVRGVSDGAGITTWEVPLSSGRVTIKAGEEDEHPVPAGWAAEIDAGGCRLRREGSSRGGRLIPVLFGCPVASATVECVPVVERIPPQDTWVTPWDVLTLDPWPIHTRWRGWGSAETVSVYSDQLPFLDLALPYALVFTDVEAL